MALRKLTVRRLQHAEEELRALLLLIDGRHSRDGSLTWPTIRTGVEDAWRQLSAVLDGAPAGGETTTVSPCEKRQAGLAELEEIGNLLEHLHGRVVSVRWAV